jgi:hypothetical protein
MDMMARHKEYNDDPTPMILPKRQSITHSTIHITKDLRTIIFILPALMHINSTTL